MSQLVAFINRDCVSRCAVLARVLMIQSGEEQVLNKFDVWFLASGVVIWMWLIIQSCFERREVVKNNIDEVDCDEESFEDVAHMADMLVSDKRTSIAFSIGDRRTH